MPNPAATNTRSLSDDAKRIWQAGVDSVRPELLLPQAIHIEGHRLSVEGTCGQIVETDLRGVRRLLIVGAGKAGAGMARGLEAALGEQLLADKQMSGLLSVPADCVNPAGNIQRPGNPSLPNSLGTCCKTIELVAGRPAGVNEPRPEGAVATQRMLRLVAKADADDLVICLLSGGGSALLPAPTSPITLAQKITLTKKLSASGATIEQINVVRQQLSDVKGGGLARACRARQLWTLVISDVLGDPLDLIASGPTVMATSTPADALAVLEQLGLSADATLAPILTFLQNRPKTTPTQPKTKAPTVLLANNAAAVDAAGMEAERLGYNHAMTCATQSEGPAEEVGRHLATMAVQMRDSADPLGPNCLISGGEPTVELAPEAIRGLGGRNQQLTLAALQEVLLKPGGCQNIAILSGGTDGEDGPTDAAGAWIDERIAKQAQQMGVSIKEALQRNDAYHFFEPLDALLKSGPTHTNVCDLRVVTVERQL